MSESLSGLEAYCVKCKAKRVMGDAEPEYMAKGRPATRGVCSACGTGLFKIALEVRGQLRPH